MWILVMFELMSVAIFSIMIVTGGFNVVIKDFERRNQYDDIGISLGLMAFLGGWFLAPFFVWLVYRYYVLTHK